MLLILPILILIFFIQTAEGLVWAPIHYTTNQPVIDLIVRRPTGLLYIAEELCLLNRGQRDEDALLAAFNAAHGGAGAGDRSSVSRSGENSGSSGSGSVYERPRFGTKNLFIVNHFAGSVTYSVSGWLDKNNDALQEDLLSLLMCSSNTFIQNAIVAVGMPEVANATSRGTMSSPEGQLGFVAEVEADRLVPGIVEGREDRDLYSVYPNPGERCVVCVVL